MLLATAATDVLEWAAIGMYALGGLVVLGFAAWLVRSGEWRDPLASVMCDGPAPGPLVLMAVLCAYASLAILTTAALQLDSGSLRTPGSSGWHLAVMAEAVGKLGASALMLLLLKRYPLIRGPAEELIRQPADGTSPELAQVPAASSAAGAPAARFYSTLPLAKLVRVVLAATLAILAICTLQLYAAHTAWEWLLPHFERPVHGVLEALRESAWGAAGAWQLVFVAVVVAPLSEELFFRGLLLHALLPLGSRWLAVVFSAIAFGFLHFTQPQDVLPLITMGVILGYVRLRYDSLLACVLIHALFNGRTMVFVLIAPELLDRAV